MRPPIAFAVVAATTVAAVALTVPPTAFAAAPTAVRETPAAAGPEAAPARLPATSPVIPEPGPAAPPAPAGTTRQPANPVAGAGPEGSGPGSAVRSGSVARSGPGLAGAPAWSAPPPSPRLPAADRGRPRTTTPAGPVRGVVRALGPAGPALAAVPGGARLPVGCGSPSGGAFPIGTRIVGAPDVHHPGGGFESWGVELTNTTGRECREVHPVLVFAARDRGLTPDRMVLEFYDPGAARWRGAQLETSGEDEVVGVLGTQRARGGGFTVGARSAVTVRVRLALTGETPPNQVTVNAAVVQRRGDDGDWVGESGDYRFAVLEDRGPGATVTRDELATTGTGSTLRLAAALGMVLAGGGALVLISRCLRRTRG
ncbi:hypothetical protein ABZ714_07040 [Streptomyces sp. NPDC006798]|uniref:hypothetical protein n=1 Tax=Streptomyces sp. NPDC006798 TaxID=3155462 RepID=UPI0033D9C162